MRHKLLATAIAANVILGTSALAAGNYYEGEGYVRVHDSVGSGYAEQNDNIVYGPFFVHLHDFAPGQVVRVKLEHRGFHPTNPYDKLAGPYNLTVGADGQARTDYLQLPPLPAEASDCETYEDSGGAGYAGAGCYKVKIQLNYGTDSEVKDYYDFEVRQQGSAPAPQPSPSPSPYPSPAPTAGHALKPGEKVTITCG